MQAVVLLWSNWNIRYLEPCSNIEDATKCSLVGKVVLKQLYIPFQNHFEKENFNEVKQPIQLFQRKIELCFGRK